MRIFTGELHKLLSQKIIWMLGGVLLLLNAFLFFQDVEATKTMSSLPFNATFAEYSELPIDAAIATAQERLDTYNLIIMLKNIQSIYQDDTLAKEAFIVYAEPLQIDSEKFWTIHAKNVADIGQLQNDSSYLYDIIAQLQYINTYPKFISNMQHRVDEMRNSPIFKHPNTFSYRNILKTGNDFKMLEGITLSAGNQTGITAVSSFAYADILMMCFSFMLCYYLFSFEREQGLLKLIKATANGRYPVIVSKLLVLITLTIFGAGLFYVCVLTLGQKMLGFGDMSRYIQSISAFRDCPVLLSVGQYLTFFFCLKIVVAVLVALLIAVFFQLSEFPPLTYILIAGASVLEYLLYVLIHPASVINLLKFVNIFSFFDVCGIFRIYANINIVGYPFNRITLSIVSIVFLVILLLFLTIGLFGWQWSGLKPPQFMQSVSSCKVRRAGSVNLFFHEVFKCLITSKRYLVLLAALLIAYRFVDITPLYVDRQTSSYLMYVNKYGGFLTPEKHVEIAREKQTIENTPNELLALTQDMSSGALTKESFQKQFYNLQFSMEQAIGFPMFEQQFEYLCSLKLASEPSIISTVSSDYIFDNPQKDLMQTAILILLIITGISCIFPIDTQSDMQNILRSTVRGRRKLLYIKTLTALCFSTVLCMLMSLPNLLNMLLKYKITAWNAPIQSIELFSEVDINVTVAQFIIGVAALRFFTIICMTVFIIMISQLIKRQALVILGSTVVFILPIMLKSFGFNSVDFFSVNNAFGLYQSLADPALQWKNCLYFVSMAFISGGTLWINDSLYTGKLFYIKQKGRHKTSKTKSWR